MKTSRIRDFTNCDRRDDEAYFVTAGIIAPQSDALEPKTCETHQEAMAAARAMAVELDREGYSPDVTVHVALRPRGWSTK